MRALIVVDVQNDFVEGGALAVKGGIQVAWSIWRYIRDYGSMYSKVVFTKDWHNPLPDTNGGHFAVSNDPDFVNSWPVHCVAGTPGAKLVSYLITLPGENEVFYKGQGRPDYSGFQGINDRRASLVNYLESYGITEVDVVGIAGDYCVLQTALDAKQNGFGTRILPQFVASVGGHEATLAAVRTLDNLH